MIRRATHTDTNELVRIINAAYEIEKVFIDGDRIDAGEIAAHLDDDVILVLEEDQALTGCVLVKPHGDRGYLGLLSVDPARQGGGRSRGLIAAAETLCREAGCTAIELLIVNLRDELIPYYRHFGFDEISVEPWTMESATRLKRPAHFLRYSKPL